MQQNELKVVDEMVSDMRFAIEWMRKGRRPYARRGVDIRDAYSRSILMDMDLLPAAVTPEVEQETAITLAEKKTLVKIMLQLSTRERQCYLLHMAQGMSLTEIAEELKMKKASVQRYVTRAKS
ncbi:sigma factor-like helix-turn-helix DNA-binding protein, partial [Paenarthrobacter sp. YAF11_1]|uniref:sigma factor-like helix-turn-helix DNA-binding protein n=1 Tax=Paenarthrobacter sp. YAF11_1 TaxID=3233074 RepID=UPI003F9A861D